MAIFACGRFLSPTKGVAVKTSRQRLVFDGIELIEDGYACAWQVLFTDKGSGGKTITSASSSSFVNFVNSATTVNASSVLSPKNLLEGTSPMSVKAQSSSKGSA